MSYDWVGRLVLYFQIPYDRFAQRMASLLSSFQDIRTRVFGVIAFFAFEWDHWHYRRLGRQADVALLTIYNTKQITGWGLEQSMYCQ